MKLSKDREPSRFFNKRTLHIFLIVVSLFLFPPIAFVFNRGQKYVKNWIIWTAIALYLVQPLLLVGLLGMLAMVDVAEWLVDGGLPLVPLFSLDAGIFEEILFIPLFGIAGMISLIMSAFNNGDPYLTFVETLYYAMPIFFTTIGAIFIFIICLLMKKIRKAGRWWMAVPILLELLVIRAGLLTFSHNISIYNGMGKTELMQSFLYELTLYAQVTQTSIVTQLIRQYFAPAILFGVGAIIAWIIYGIFKTKNHPSSINPPTNNNNSHESLKD